MPAKCFNKIILRFLGFNDLVNQPAEYELLPTNSRIPESFWKRLLQIVQQIHSYAHLENQWAVDAVEKLVPVYFYMPNKSRVDVIGSNPKKQRLF